MAEPIDALAAALRSGAADERLAAAEKLAQLGREARAAAVELVEACNSDDDQLREWVAAALEEMGPPEIDDLAKLAALLDRQSLDAAYWAATLLGRLEDLAAPAVGQLARALADHPDMAVRQRAAWALGKIGSAAEPARDALDQAAKDPNRRLATLAKTALDRLSD